MFTVTCQDQKCGERLLIHIISMMEEACFVVWQRVETLTATGCFCLNKKKITLCPEMVITLHEIVKNHFDFDYSHISFSIW